MIAGCALALLILLPVVAQEGGDEVQEQEIVRLEAWPELSGEGKRSIKLEIDRLRKARTEEMGDDAAYALTKLGASIVPSLLPKLGKEKDEAALARMVDVLERVTGAEHTRLLAREFGDKSQAVRTWAMHRTAAYPDPGVRAEAEKALDRVAKRLAKAKKKPKPDRHEHYVAALVTTSSGSLAGLDHLQVVAVKKWGDYGKDMRAALEAVRGPEATKALAGALREGDRKVKVATLNLLAGCGHRETAVGLVRPHLDDVDNSIRIAAINALRGIVDGDPPIDKLPVFRAIEIAKEWKSRV